MMNKPAGLDVLLSLCGPRFAEAAQEGFLDYVDQSLDWTALFQAALAHSVAPLVAHRLLSLQNDRLPSELREGLALYLEGERLRGQTLAGELASLLTSFADQGIPTIPIKGPQLALALFGDVGLRGCRDLDILVRDADVDRALAILEGMGYRHDAALSTRQIQAVRRYGGQYILFRPGHAPVEPHWLIAPTTLAFELDYGRLWQSARSGDFLGAPCLRLPLEEELLLLCLHGGKEGWHKLKWICDLAVFVDIHPRIDWERLYAEATRVGCARMLNLGLLLGQCLLNAPVPAALAQYYRQDTQAGWLAEDVIGKLGRSEKSELNPYRLSSYYWRLRERPRDRLAYALRTLLTPRALHYGLVPLPPAFGWGYYPIKLTWDYLLIPVRVVAKSIGVWGAGRRRQ